MDDRHIICGECGENNITTLKQDGSYKWGNILVECEIPVRYCNNCGFIFTDWEAEDIRDSALKTKLAQMEGEENE
jgi:NMD protein affecting ribosome stability and mRNA decay